MKFLFRTTTNRTTASLMLAVWLFVLASGFANACMLEAPNHGGHQPSSESSHTTAHVAAAAHENEQTPNAPCLKACDEGSQALQGNYGVDSVDPGSPPLAAVIWTEPSLLLARHWSGFEAQPSLSDPPERIIYSRWAL
jgi:hypothetical protein